MRTFRLGLLSKSGKVPLSGAHLRGGCRRRRRRGAGGASCVLAGSVTVRAGCAMTAWLGSSSDFFSMVLVSATEDPVSELNPLSSAVVSGAAGGSGVGGTSKVAGGVAAAFLMPNNRKIVPSARVATTQKRTPAARKSMSMRAHGSLAVGFFTARGVALLRGRIAKT